MDCQRGVDNREAVWGRRGAMTTLLTPYGYSSSSCGYCAPTGSGKSKSATSLKYGSEHHLLAISDLLLIRSQWEHLK